MTKFPITTRTRWKNRLGSQAAPCCMTGRWLRISERAIILGGVEHVYVEVMAVRSDATEADPTASRKVTTLLVSREDLQRVVNAVRPASEG